MNITTEHANGIAVVRVGESRLMYPLLSEFSSAVQTLISSGERRVVIDLSGRPGLSFDVRFARAMIGTFDVDRVHEFFQGFVNHAQATLHVDNLKGDNAHHQAETVFKAFARALRMAVARDERAGAAIPSTKGAL